MLTLKGNTHLAQHVAETYPEYPGSWKPINAEQAKALFAEKAAFIGRTDAYTLTDALELFGWRIPFTVLDCDDKGTFIGRYGGMAGFNNTAPGSIQYFSLAGFLYAVSLANEHVLYPAQTQINEQEHIDFDERDAQEEREYQARKAAAKAKREAAKAKKEAAVNG